MLIGAPPSGPSGSTIAGILLFGLIFTKAGANCSPLPIFTGFTVYGTPISSNATLILRPFGVFQVWSSMVIAKSAFLNVRLVVDRVRQDCCDCRRLQDAIDDIGRSGAGAAKKKAIPFYLAKPRPPLQRAQDPFCPPRCPPP